MREEIKFKDWIFLNKTVSPILIKIVYYILLILLVIGTIRSTYEAYLVYSFFYSIIFFVFSLVGGYLSIRIAAELLLALFQIKDLLQEKSSKGEK